MDTLPCSRVVSNHVIVCLDGTLSNDNLVFFAGRRHTLLETSMEPKNGWLEYKFPFGKPYFQGRAVSFRECKDLKLISLELMVHRMKTL